MPAWRICHSRIFIAEYVIHPLLLLKFIPRGSKCVPPTCTGNIGIRLRNIKLLFEYFLWYENTKQQSNENSLFFSKNVQKFSLMTQNDIRTSNLEWTKLIDFNSSGCNEILRGLCLPIKIRWKSNTSLYIDTDSARLTETKWGTDVCPHKGNNLISKCFF